MISERKVRAGARRCVAALLQPATLEYDLPAGTQIAVVFLATEGDETVIVAEDLRADADGASLAESVEQAIEVYIAAGEMSEPKKRKKLFGKGE